MYPAEIRYMYQNLVSTIISVLCWFCRGGIRIRDRNSYRITVVAATEKINEKGKL